MFLTKKDLITNLQKIRKSLCGYISDFCDCKYGATHVGDAVYEQSGCPEIRTAISILNVMTDEEYNMFITRMVENHDKMRNRRNIINE